MKVFFGGQIMKGCRGDLSLVITESILGNKATKEYASFLYPTNSEDFIHLTGIRSVDNELFRVYIGLNKHFSEEIMRRASDKPKEKVDLDSLDKLVVQDLFLKKYDQIQKPARVVLESTKDGYTVSQVEL